MHVCRSSVLLPPMLGPVSSSAASPACGAAVSRTHASASSTCAGAWPSTVSLGTKEEEDSVVATHGCRAARRSRKELPPSSTAWNSGLHTGRSDAFTSTAKPHSTSSADASAASRRHCWCSDAKRANTRRITSALAASARSSAAVSSSSMCRTSGVQYRRTPLRCVLSSYSSGTPARSSTASLTWIWNRSLLLPQNCTSDADARSRRRPDRIFCRCVTGSRAGQCRASLHGHDQHGRGSVAFGFCRQDRRSRMDK